MSRVLVIGGTLFVGRSLVEQLLSRGDEVVVMHRGDGTPFGERVGELRCDRNDVAGVQRALDGRRFDVIYDNVYDWQRGTTAEQVAAAALAGRDGLRRYVFTSTVAVYGAGGTFDERAPLVPPEYPEPYSRQKADSERALFALHRDTQLPMTTLRPTFIYGPHNPMQREAFFWDRLRADRPIIVADDGSQPMQWVHVDDVARAAVRAAGAEVANGRAYNLAGPPLTQLQFVEALARAAGRTPKIVHVSRARLQSAGGGVFKPPLYFGEFLDIPAIAVSATAAREDLGLEFTPLEEGLRETYRWYERQDRPTPDFTWEDSVLAGGLHGPRPGLRESPQG